MNAPIDRIASEVLLGWRPSYVSLGSTMYRIIWSNAGDPKLEEIPWTDLYENKNVEALA